MDRVRDRTKFSGRKVGQDQQNMSYLKKYLSLKKRRNEWVYSTGMH